MRQITHSISTRCRNGLLLSSKPKSPVGSCIAEVYPHYGIRGIVRSVLRRRSIFRARRKRSRPLIAAAYPDLPDAGQSGFLLVLQLPAGPSEITIQVQDHDKIWRTIFVTDIWAFPLTFVGWIGLPHVEQFFVTYLTEFFLRNRRNIATSIMPQSIAQGESSLHRTRLQTFASRARLNTAAKSKQYICSLLRNRICLSAKSPNYFAPASVLRVVIATFGGSNSC